jgi:hypothetical protein
MTEMIEMNPGVLRGRVESLLAFILMLLAVLAGEGGANAQGRGPAPAPATAQAAAPKDLTGYWVSVVTEDWRWRMVLPIKGDFASVPLNPEGRKVATAWDPANDKPGDDQCKPYGAASIMRVPGRLHIAWADGNTLRIDTDSGTQTRLLHFGGSPPAAAAPQWQGYSDASWEGIPRGRGAQAPKAGEDPRGYLKVITTHMRPGYLRRNGIPYGANATLEEYLDRFSEPNGDIWLVATIIVTDPEYLNQPYVTHSQFKKIPDASGWDPTPCRMNEAR